MCPVVLTELAGRPPLGVDAFTHIPRILDGLQVSALVVILVALEHTSTSWFPCLQRLLVGRWWKLPSRGDALFQAGGAMRSYTLLSQPMWFWPLKGDTWRGLVVSCEVVLGAGGWTQWPVHC